MPPPWFAAWFSRLLGSENNWGEKALRSLSAPGRAVTEANPVSVVSGSREGGGRRAWEPSRNEELAAGDHQTVRLSVSADSRTVFAEKEKRLPGNRKPQSRLQAQGHKELNFGTPPPKNRRSGPLPAVAGPFGRCRRTPDESGSRHSCRCHGNICKPPRRRSGSGQIFPPPSQ